jgi:hypothetical protein
LPPDPVLTGESLGGVEDDGEREQARASVRITRGRREVFLERDEGPFIHALAAVLSREER